MKYIIPINEYKINKYIAYHGSKNEFEHFDYAYIGIGNDQHGPGFYFVNNYDDALGYGKVNKFELTMSKIVSSKKRPSRSDVIKLIKWAPEYKDTLVNFNENEYQALQQAIIAYMRYDQLESYTSIWGDFYLKKGNSSLFVKNLVKLGYDGHIITETTRKLYIMYNTDKIKRLND
jgi:hypothetical protein